jgi:hypothetical protein
MVYRRKYILLNHLGDCLDRSDYRNSIASSGGGNERVRCVRMEAVKDSEPSNPNSGYIGEFKLVPLNDELYEKMMEVLYVHHQSIAELGIKRHKKYTDLLIVFEGLKTPEEFDEILSTILMELCEERLVDY